MAPFPFFLKKIIKKDLLSQYMKDERFVEQNGEDPCK